MRVAQNHIVQRQRKYCLITARIQTYKMFVRQFYYVI